MTERRGAPPRSPTPPAAEVDHARGIALLNRVDRLSGYRNALRSLDPEKHSTYAGIPMALEGDRIRVCPKYPLAEIFNKPKPDREAELEIRVRNSFHSRDRRAYIWVYEKDGRVRFTWEPEFHAMPFLISTLGVSSVWGIEQEGNAVKTLGTLLRHHPFKQYLLTGMFLETSKRSGLTYMFRRLRPTVVLSARPGLQPRYYIGDTSATWKDNADAHILTTLCLHPIGYYEQSWAGAMCPTDDVIAHLLMMRGDEPMFWRKANQIPPHLPNAGLS